MQTLRSHLCYIMMPHKAVTGLVWHNPVSLRTSLKISFFETRNPFVFCSTGLCKTHRPWAVIEKCYSICWAVTQSNFYLYSSQFVIKTDYAPLHYILSSPNLTNRKKSLSIKHSRELINHYIYLPGKENCLAHLLLCFPNKKTDKPHKSEPCSEEIYLDISDKAYKIGALDVCKCNPRDYVKV